MGLIRACVGKNVAFTFIRPQRYTKEFVDKEETHSICFFDKSYTDVLRYLGTTSGKEENKIMKAGLTAAMLEGTPYFEEANLVLLVKKLYQQELTAESFLDDALKEKIYPEKDYHTLYVSEINKIYLKGLKSGKNIVE